MPYPLQSASEILQINLTLFSEKEIRSFNKVTLISLINKTYYGFGNDDNDVPFEIVEGPGGVPSEFYRNMRKTIYHRRTKPAPEKEILLNQLIHQRKNQIQKSIYHSIDANNHREYEHVSEELFEIGNQLLENDLTRQNNNACTLNHTTNINIENNMLPNHIQTSLLINTELTCIVCLNDLDNENVAITKCGHNYCKDCLGITLSLDKARQKCGQCRIEFR